MSTILSIQSSVSYGHAGNSAAVFPLQRIGVEVWPVYTVTFSNHTGYGAWRGPLIAASDVIEIVRGIDDRQVLGQVDAILSGYQGGEEVGQAILEAVELVGERSPKAIYCCDPVMGDVGRGFYARPGIPEFIRDRVVPVADVVTPNLFELEFLTGRSGLATVEQTVAAAHELRAQGPGIVVVTSVVQPGDDQVMRMVAVTDDGCWQVETPLLDRTFTGSGDLTTAMFLAHLLKTGEASQALSATASIVFSVLKATADLDSRELALVATQEQLVNPTHIFTATAL